MSKQISPTNELPAAHGTENGQAAERLPTVAVSSGSLYTYGLARFFELAAEAGARHVEVILDERWDTRQVHYMLRLREQYELPIVALHAPFWRLPEMAQDYLHCIPATIRVAESVGARVVVIHPEWSKQRSLAPRVREVVERLQPTTPVTLAVENMPYKLQRTLPRYPTITAERIARFRAITLDTAHFGTAGIDLLAAYRTIAKQTRHVHLSDYRDGQEHLMPGDGVLPLGQFLQQLTADGYEGIVTLELEPAAVHAGKSDDAVVARLRRALDFCRQHLLDMPDGIAQSEPVRRLPAAR